MVLDLLYKLHYDTIPPDVYKTRSTDKFLSFRLGKYDGYIADVKNQNLNISFRTLMIAYITKYTILNKRKESEYSGLDFMIQYDEKFLNGMWDIILSISVPNEKIKPFQPFDPDDINILFDTDFIKLSPHSMITEYKKFYNNPDIDLSIFNKLLSSLPGAFRPSRTRYEVPMKCMVECFRLDYINTPEPFEGFWLYYANLWWKFMHWNMRNIINRSITMFNNSMLQYKNYSVVYQNN